MIIHPPRYGIGASAGDEIVIMCYSSYDSLLWKLQNETSYAEYSVYDNGYGTWNTPYVPVDLPDLPGVSITLLTDASGSGKYINSSLQFVVSEEFVEARVTCDNQDYRAIVHAVGKL